MTTPDYRRLIDAEMWAWMDRSDAFYPPGAVGLTIEEQRAVYDRMCAAFYQGRPDGVAVTDERYGDVPCRRYESGASDVSVVYYHGGGFVVGGLDSHDDVCAEMCQRTGFRVISVDYGLAPEIVFPGCFNDAWAACQAVAARWPGPMILCGDSAGGNLAAAVTHKARDQGQTRIVGQVLIYAGLGGDPTRGSYVEHSDAPQLTTADMEFYKAVRTGGAGVPEGDARFAPLQDSDFSGLPPSVLISAQCDPLASDSEAYRDAILAAGGKAHWHDAPGMVHGCLRARVMSAGAARFFDEVIAAVAALGQGQWPYDAPKVG